MNSHKLICSPNSGETYYFRSYIPKDLIEYFDGVRQFRVSLKCAIKSRSIRITKILDVKVSSLFEEIRIGMKSLDIEQIKGILRIEIRKQILHSHRVREGTNRWDDDGIKRSLDSIQKKETILKDRLKSDSEVIIFLPSVNPCKHCKKTFSGHPLHFLIMLNSLHPLKRRRFVGEIELIFLKQIYFQIICLIVFLIG
jgi:hypothetical protein